MPCFGHDPSMAPRNTEIGLAPLPRYRTKEAQTEAARMAQTDRATYRRRKRQPERLTSTITEERPRACLSTRHMNRNPSRIAHRADFDLFRVDVASSLQLAAYLSNQGLALTLLPATEMVPWRHVGGHRFPASNLNRIESRRWRHSPIERDQMNLPFVVVAPRGRPGQIARRRPKNCLMVIFIECTTGPPDQKSRWLTLLAPHQKLSMAVPLERSTVGVLASHVRHRFARRRVGTAPRRRRTFCLDPQELSEH